MGIIIHNPDPLTVLRNSIDNLINVGLCISLAFVRDRRYHAVLVPVLIVYTAFWVMQQQVH